ncbi:unnamed protein product [Closterium sp. NIES-54]
MASLHDLPFDHEGRPIQIDTWLDGLQLYLLSDSRDSVSLFDHASRASPSPPAITDSSTCSQWLTRDAAARIAIRNHLLLAECAHFGQHRTAHALYDVVVARYSSPATAALGQFLDRNQPLIFITLYFIVTRLPDSLSSIRDHFLALDPTGLTVDLLEQHLLAAETSVVTVGAARGTPRTPFFEGFSQRGASGGSGSCAYVIRTGDRAGQTCGKPHTQHRCFSRLNDAWCAEFGDKAERPRWAELLRFGVAIFDLDYDAILATMYALYVTAEGDCCLCVPPDPGIEAAALGASESALPGTAPTQVSASGLVAPLCSCCLLSHQTILWHHRLGHPSLPRLRGMHSRLLVSGVPRSLPPLPPSPAPPCLPCVEGRQRAAPHSSFPSTTAPLQTLHMYVWGPARVSGQGRERYFLLSVSSSASGSIRTFMSCVCTLTEVVSSALTFYENFVVGRAFSNRSRFRPPLSKNGTAERRIGLVMEVARTSMIHAAAPHFLWPFAVRYAAHQLNLWPRVSLPENLPLHWRGKVGDASVFRVLGLACLCSRYDVTFDQSVPFYRLFLYHSAPPPPPPLFLAPGPPPVDPLPPQGPAPSSVSQVDPLPDIVLVEVAVNSGAARGAASGGAAFGGAVPGGAEPGGVEPGGAELAGVEPGGAEPEGVEPGGAEPEGAESRGAEPQGTAFSGGLAAAGAGPSAIGCVGATRLGGAGVTAGAGGTGGVAAAGPEGARTRGTGAAGTGSVGGAGVGGARDGDPAEPGGAGAGAAGAGGTGAGGAGAGGARVGDSGVTGGLIERREPESRPASPVRAVRIGRRVPRPRPPPVPGTHAMALHPSSVPLRVPLPLPPESSLPDVPDPDSDLTCAASPTVSRLLATVVTDPSFESITASTLFAELVDFAVACRLDYANALVAESESASPPSVGGECALGTDALQDRQEDFECLVASIPRFASMLLAPEGDPDLPDILTPCSYAEAITDAVEPVEVAVDSGAAKGAEPEGAGSGGAESGGAEPGGAEPGGAESGGAEPGGAERGGAEAGGAEPWGAESARVASRGASSRRELLSPQELREWFARRWSRAAGAGGSPVSLGPRGARTRGTGAAGAGGAAATTGVGPAGASGATNAGAAGGVGAGVGAAGASGAASAGAASAGAASAGAAGGVGAGVCPSGGPVRPRPYFVPLLEQVLGLPPSPGPAPPLECPQPVPSQSPLQPVSPLPAPSPYAGPTGGLAERREPASRPALPVSTTRPSRRAPRLRPPAVPGTHQMTLRPSTAPLRVPLPSPPESSLPVLADPASASLRAASPTVARLLSTVVTGPSFESTAASALVAELVDFAVCCRLDFAASLVAESASVCPPSIGGECALSTDVLEDQQEEFQCFAAVLPHLVSMLIAREGDPDAPDIPTPRSYAEAIEGPYSSQWQSAMDAEMASWMSTGTYVDDVPPPGANIVSGMWIFRVKRPPGSPPVFKARYVARGFSQRQGVDYFQTFSPTPKMTTLRVLLHVAAQRDYELHSLDFSTAFLQGSLHEEIWLGRPPGFTRLLPPGTQWSLRRLVYGLRQAPREWHDTLRTTLAALGFAPSTADPSLFLRTDTSLPPFYILVYVDDLVFATADTAGLAHVKSELQKRHTCTDLGELRSYLGLQITRERA